MVRTVTSLIIPLIIETKGQNYCNAYIHYSEIQNRIVSLDALKLEMALDLELSLFFLSLEIFYVILIGFISRAFMLSTEDIFCACNFYYSRLKTSWRLTYLSDSWGVNFSRNVLISINPPPMRTRMLFPFSILR